MKKSWKKALRLVLLFSFLFLVGWETGHLRQDYAVSTMTLSGQADNWGLGFGAEGAQPSGNVTAEELKKYDAFYVGDPDKKVIYLTFDCGYENGNTEPILDALKKHNAPATFFVVGHFLETAPESTVRKILRWQSSLDMRHFSGALRMWTGMWMRSPQRRRRLISC